MLGKLIKNEFKATYRSFFILFGSLLLLAVFARFCITIPFHNVIYNIFVSILTFLYVLLLICLTLFSFVMMINRFRTNMLKDEGYLTHTLPVTIDQHIIAKLVSNLVWMIASVVTMVVSFGIYFIGKNEFFDFMRGLGSVLNQMSKRPGFILICIQGIILLILQFIVTMLAIYAAMGIGQLFTKHKVLGSVGAYFAMNYALGMILSVVMYALPDSIITRLDNLDSLPVEKAIHTATVATNELLLMLIVLELILGVIYYLVCRYMLSKKLNLE